MPRTNKHTADALVTKYFLKMLIMLKFLLYYFCSLLYCSLEIFNFFHVL